MRKPYCSLLAVTVFALLLSTGARAVELTCAASFGLPQGKLKRVMNDGLLVGGHLRVSGSLSAEESFLKPRLFGEFGVVDFGDETDYIAREYGYSGVDVGSDTYCLTAGPGLVFESRKGYLRPSVGLYGGFAYYSVMGYIWQRGSTFLKPVRTCKTSTWYAGAETGIAILFWQRGRDSTVPMLDEVLISIKVGYSTTGNVTNLPLDSMKYESGELVLDERDIPMTRFSMQYGLAIMF